MKAMGKSSFRLIIAAVISFLVLAANSVALQLSPVSVEMEAKRGSSEVILFKIGNDSAKSVRCRFFITGFDIERNGERIFEKAENKYSVPGWLKAKESEFEVGANSEKEIAVDVNIPRNAVPGEYFAVILVENAALMRGKNPENKEVFIEVNYRLGCIARITVPGVRAIVKKAGVSDIKVGLPAPENKFQDIKVWATFENKCQAHLDVIGEARIKAKGKIYDKFVLQASGMSVKGEAFIFPEGKRDFFGTVEKPLPAGEYTAEIIFDYGSRTKKILAAASFIVKDDLSKKQKEFLTLNVQPSLISLVMMPGAFRTGKIELTNIDFEPLCVKILSSSSWLKVRPSELTIRPNGSTAIRIEIFIPPGEPVKRNGKISIWPERGKQVDADIIISEPKKESAK